jgi:streptogramin lyase
MSEDYYSDNGQPIASVRIAPPIEDDNRNMFISKLQLDAETGVGDLCVIPYMDFTLETGANPYGITSGFGYIWVANEIVGTISKINPLTKTVVATITPGGGFAGAGITCNDNYVWACDGNGANNKILKINPSTNAIENTIAVGVGPVAIISNDNFLWVVNNIDATLSKIDITLETVIAVIPLGIDPVMICYAFDHVWVTCAGSDEIWKIDPATDVVVANIATGVAPMMPAAGFGFIWTANQSGTISKIDPATELMVHDFVLPVICECLVCSRSSIWASGDTLYKINPVTYAIEAILTGLPNPLDIALFVTDEEKEILWIGGITDNYVTALFLDTDLASVNPQALLSWSVDGGHTWSNDHPTSMGKLGKYLTRMIWRRLGASKNRCFRVAITAAVKKVLIGCYMEYTRGMH